MEAEAFDTLVAQNKVLSQQINMFNSKLGTMQLAAANTQIGTCDLCGIQDHSSETCAAILEQQSSEKVNYMAYERSPNTFPSNTITNPKEECKAIQLRSGKKVEKKIEESAEDSSQNQQEKMMQLLLR
ncbi:hypothetical protein PIB30_006412 [Stylosanthes scabra]|uniref:Uncharacterized protein n=1 Tax=Stylosanthes scabra TaxID=79078 RepID=A0ABU6T426_9FABA|nr:hypothetical protein [Stylosanthes scabra]